MRAVLCIGGLDPAGRAGILADARAVTAMGARPLCVATALTLQTSKRAAGYEPVAAGLVERQVEMLLADEDVGAIKLGQLATPEIAAVLSRIMRAPLVVDTPLATSSGVPLFESSNVREAYTPLWSQATLVTPNREEVFVLAGGGCTDALEAARSLAVPVLLKGGHASGSTVEDLLLRPGAEAISFRSDRLAGHFRGTGCRLASAIAARLALGDALEPAIETARSWLVAELRLNGSH